MTATISAAEYMAAAPKSVSGSSPWSARYSADIKRAWLDHAARDPRTLQQHLGPSELGVECDRQVAGKFAALPETNHVVDPWPSMRGKALHAYAEDVFTQDNLRTGLLRWLTERKVTPHPDHPGTADLYDALEQCVVDHKFLGESTLAKIRKGWPRKYKVQLLLYGLGYFLLGLPVQRVVIAAYPATAASLDGLFCRDMDFAGPDGQPLPVVIELLSQVLHVETPRRKAYAEQIVSGAIGFQDVPATADSDECYFCPFFRPEAAHKPELRATSCAGTSGGAS